MELVIREITDDYIRENFERIQRHLSRGTPFDGFLPFEIITDGPITNGLHRHGLGYLPLDIVESYVAGSGTLTWNRARFTNEYLDFSTSGPVRIRGLVGTFKRTGRVV